jgi:hypothetical protein
MKLSEIVERGARSESIIGEQASLIEASEAAREQYESFEKRFDDLREAVLAIDWSEKAIEADRLLLALKADVLALLDRRAGVDRGR